MPQEQPTTLSWAAAIVKLLVGRDDVGALNGHSLNGRLYM
jgi:hypothetical protein